MRGGGGEAGQRSWLETGSGVERSLGPAGARTGRDATRRTVRKSRSKTTFSLTNILFCNEQCRSYSKRALVVASQESRQRMKNIVILRHISRNGMTFVVMERFFSYDNDSPRSETTTIVKKFSDKFVVNLRQNF